MSDPIQHYSQSAWQAARAIAAEAIGPPKLAEHIALPGARQAVAHDRLLAYQDAGMGEHEVVGRVNARWGEEYAERLEAHRRWVAGPYASAVEEMAKRAAEAQAEELRRRAAFERILREHEEG